VKFVSAKSLAQQGTLALLSVRSLLVKQQTMLANAMRGLATEFGLTAPQGIGKLEDLMALVDTDEASRSKPGRRSEDCSTSAVCWLKG
jgi:transposase